MADIQNHQLNSDDIRDLLSSYLDGEVTEEERGLVEQALTTSPELRQELETLRRTVALLTALPPMPAPRPFTLTEADVKIVTPASKNLFGFPAWFRSIAALAAVLLCVIAAGSLFWSMQFNRAGQPAAEIANAPAMTPSTVAPEAQSAAAPVQPIPPEESAPAGDAAREAPAPAAPATEEAMVAAAEAAPTQSPPAATAGIALAVPSADEATEQAAPPPAGQAPVTEGEAITATQPDQSDTTQQSLAVQSPTATEAEATPLPDPTVMTFAAPAQEPAPEQAAGGAAESAETGQMAAESAAAPTQPAVAEKAGAGDEVQTDQLRTESAPAPTEAPVLKQAAPSPTPTSTLISQPSATVIPTLPAASPPVVSVTSTPSTSNTPGNFWPVAGMVVAGLLVITGAIIWLVRRNRL